MYFGGFYKTLDSSDLNAVEEAIANAEEPLAQMKTAIINERIRRETKENMERMERREDKKVVKKFVFKKKRRSSRLKKATPYKRDSSSPSLVRELSQKKCRRDDTLFSICRILLVD